MVRAREPSNAKLRLFAKLNYLSAFLQARMTKQTAQRQSVGDRLQKCARLFWYSD